MPERYERSEARQRYAGRPATSASCRPRPAKSVSGSRSFGARPSRRRSSNVTAGARARSRKRLIEMYLAGVSVRRVEDITEALWGTRVSPSTVSDLNKKIYGTIEAWRNRPIEGEHPYVYLDGIVLKRSWAGEVRNVSLLVAIGVNGEGYREILGICEGAKEDKAGWSAFLKHLKRPRPQGRAADHLRRLHGAVPKAPRSSSQRRRGNAASCIGTAMSSATCLRPRCARCGRCSRLSMPERRRGGRRRERCRDLLEKMTRPRGGACRDPAYTRPDIHWQIRTTDEIDKRFFVNRATPQVHSFVRPRHRSFFRPGRRFLEPPRAGAVKAGRIWGDRKARP